MTPQIVYELSADQVRSLLRYEPETGRLYWLARSRDWFETDKRWKLWNGCFAGKEAFTYLDSTGYRRGHLLGRACKAHRVIWLLQTGEWPRHNIDHINGVRDDNRWGNLRDVPHADNMRNQRRRSDNTSGINGVSWEKRSQQWRAEIMFNGRRKFLGNFDSLEQAAAARASADAKFGFSALHGRELLP